MDSIDQERAKLAADAERELVRLWRAWRTIHEMCQDRVGACFPACLSTCLICIGRATNYQKTKYEYLLIHFVTVSLTAAVPLSTPAQILVQVYILLTQLLYSRKKMTTSFKPTNDMLKKYTPLPTASNPNPVPQIGTIWIEFSTETAGIGVKPMRLFVHHITDHKFYTGILVTQAPVTPTALKLIPSVSHEATIETFQEQDLLVNITHHELVPKHIPLSAEEKKKLLERYRLKESQLPRIQTADPVAKYLGLRRGQVVKIIRKSETAGRYASYRWAI